MINKELKKLSRRELVDLIYQMKRNEEQLQEEIASLKNALEDKRIRLSEVGSIAEAATSITNVLTAAQAAADLYLNEIASMRADAELECARMIDETKVKVANVFSTCEKQLEEMKQLNEPRG